MTLQEEIKAALSKIRMTEVEQIIHGDPRLTDLLNNYETCYGIQVDANDWIEPMKQPKDYNPNIWLTAAYKRDMEPIYEAKWDKFDVDAAVTALEEDMANVLYAERGYKI